MDRSLTRSSQHILTINNDPAVLAVFRDLLEDVGYRVTTRTYVEKGLEEIVALSPDLIVLDYMWASDDGGWSLLQILRMDRRVAQIPLILCTAAVVEVAELAERLSQMGVRVILKPFNIDELLDVIDELLAPVPVVN